MSFASDVKDELIRFEAIDECCMHAELDALLKVGGTLVENHICFGNSYAAVVRHALTLIKKLHTNARTEIAVVRDQLPRRRKRYIIRLFFNNKTDPPVNHFFDNEFPINDCCRAAYLRGAFLAGGTIARPEKNYHWEINSDSESVAQFLARFMNRIDFPAKVFKRRDRFVVYLKDFDSITDFLAFTGAPNAVERCEVARNVKDVRCLANRLVNCETHNLQRAVDSAQQQIADIKLIIKYGIKISDDLMKTARARLKHPEMSMPELAPLLYLSTSGLKHRMRQLHDYAHRPR